MQYLDALQMGASQFEQSAGALKNKFWLKNLKVIKNNFENRLEEK